MNNAEQLLEAIGGIGDDLVMEAQGKPRRKWIFWSAAACAAAAVLAVLLWPRSAPVQIEPEPSLPTLEVSFQSASMGYEALMLYDIRESGEGNPWTGDARLEKLPVYRNLAYSGAHGLPVYLTEDAMLTLARKAADALGQTITETKAETMDGSLYRLTAQTETASIQVDGNGDIRIAFSEGVALPEGYRFADDATTREAEQALSWLVERFGSLVSLEDPAVNIWRDYTYYGAPNTRYSAYSRGEDLVGSILNYNFSSVSFLGTYSGTVQYIDISNRLSTAELIGDYPIITAGEAREKLLEGAYLTTVPSDCLPDGAVTADRITKTELVYRTGSEEQIYMPYYRFYVAIRQAGTEMAEGLQSYGAYYVPAVREEYLSGFPVWDESFN